MTTGVLRRFDELVRSERYFTATLLPMILLHDEFRGLKAFCELLDVPKVSSPSQPTEHLADGKQRWRSVHPTQFEPGDVELVTEFHIARDLLFAELIGTSDLESSGDDNPLKRDAPDLVIVIKDELIVVEAKFFGSCQLDAVNAQLQSQRSQISHLFKARPTLQSYRHIGLFPKTFSVAPDCDIALTWEDIAGLANRVLGHKHFVSRRLAASIAYYSASVRAPGTGKNYAGKLGLRAILALCAKDGDMVRVGHTGGVSDLVERELSYLEGKSWKWRNPSTPGAFTKKSWIAGTEFSRLLLSMQVLESESASAEESQPDDPTADD